VEERKDSRVGSARPALINRAICSCQRQQHPSGREGGLSAGRVGVRVPRRRQYHTDCARGGWHRRCPSETFGAGQAGETAKPCCEGRSATHVNEDLDGTRRTRVRFPAGPRSLH